MERIKLFPISFFALVLGFVGFALAIQKAEHLLYFPSIISSSSIVSGILWFSIGITISISAIYLMKIIFFYSVFKSEYNHPIKINFYPIIAKTLLIYSIIFLESNISLSKTLWILGALLQFIFSIKIISSWMCMNFDIKQINPSWFIPIVGSVIVPITGVAHGFTELSWFFFSGGLIWWLILFIFVLFRIIFQNKLEEKFLPTLYILFAPPSIAFISTVKLTGELTDFGRILYHISLLCFIQRPRPERINFKI